MIQVYSQEPIMSEARVRVSILGSATCFVTLNEAAFLLTWRYATFGERQAVPHYLLTRRPPRSPEQYGHRVHETDGSTEAE